MHVGYIARRSETTLHSVYNCTVHLSLLQDMKKSTNQESGKKYVALIAQKRYWV